MSFKHGSWWFSTNATLSSRGSKTYWLWTASFMQAFTAGLPPLGESPTFPDDSKRRSFRTAAKRTAGASFQSRWTFSMSQRGLFGSRRRGMVLGWSKSKILFTSLGWSCGCKKKRLPKFKTMKCMDAFRMFCAGFETLACHKRMHVNSHGFGAGIKRNHLCWFFFKEISAY